VAAGAEVCGGGPITVIVVGLALLAGGDDAFASAMRTGWQRRGVRGFHEVKERD
jgi:hypothetical protein